MTPQEKMKTKLEALGIPHKEIKVYGSQIVITARSFDSACQWVQTLSKFACVRRPAQSKDYAKVNRGSATLPSMVDVWRIWATV